LGIESVVNCYSGSDLGSRCRTDEKIETKPLHDHEFDGISLRSSYMLLGCDFMGLVSAEATIFIGRKVKVMLVVCGKLKRSFVHGR